jgi:tetratricopeptide (TPR) repeat protein
MNRNLRHLVLAIFLPIHFWAQESAKYAGENASYFRAEELYEKAQYSAAKQEFHAFISGSKEAKRNPNDPFLVKAYYYEGISALELYNNDAIPLLDAFNKAYPDNIYKNKIALKIGNFHFQNEDFESAQLAYSKVPVREVEADEKEEVLFKMGYSAFQNGDLESSYDAFRDVKDGTTQYAKPSLYFYSHISYTKNALQVALEGFQKLRTDSTFCGVVPYYIAQILHKQGKFQEVIDLAPTVLSCSVVNNEADIQHIIGDAYYQLGKYTEAISYLEKYHAKSKGTRDDFYELGFSYYKTNQFEKAIKNFDKVTRVDDSLGHISMYQIGDAYLKADKLLPARSAFERASDMTSLPTIQEDALYQFAVISFKVDINPYDESVRAFENYLARYPNTKRKSDVFQYLVNVYTTTSNYAKAIESLDKLPSMDAKLKRVYQTVAFNYGVELFQKNEYNDAMGAFKLVEKYPMDPQMVALARYWVADVYFRKKELKEAISMYREFISSPASNSLPEKIDAYYNIGYAYMEQEAYDQCIESFRTYLQFAPKDKNKVLDATFRVADCYYLTRQNLLAVEFYKNALALNSGLNDKAMYYLAKAYGYNDQASDKIKTLNDLLANFKKSKYRMNASYELGRTYMSERDFDDALLAYENFLKEYPNSTYVLDVRLEMADAYYKKWDYIKAESAYKSILAEFEQQREVCEKVVKALIDVYNAQKNPELASTIADQYPCANISKEEKENMFYSPAWNSYLDSNYAEAAPNFEIYLTKFPNGRFVNETYFYLGNSYLKTKDSVNAMNYFEKFMETPTTAYSEFAAAKLSGYYYGKKEYAKANNFYKKLDELATKPTTTFQAKLGQMRCAFLIDDFANSIVNAKFVLENAAITPQIKVEAEYSIGLSNYNLKEYNNAKPSLEWLVKNTTTSMGSEAKYLLADIYFKNKELALAETEIKALVKMKPSYNFWVAKGLMLQTRIHMLNDDLFQAEQTLKSVIDFYPDSNDGIQSEANDLWDELMQLKNPPATEEKEPEMKIEINEN